MNRLFLRCQPNERIITEWKEAQLVDLRRDIGISGIWHTLGRLPSRPIIPPAQVQSFVIASLAVFCADKLFSRKETPDAWTRQMEISIPASRQWGAEAINLLEKAICFVSGDSWRIAARKKKPDLGARGYVEGDLEPDVACLFSGGTDSLVGAVDLLEEEKRVLLVSHWESAFIAGRQTFLANELVKKYGKANVQHLSMKVQVPHSMEKSTRARSLLFVALGVCAASAFGPETPVHVPENGVIALNVPLSGSRLGSYSTRTTHPFYFDMLRKALAKADVPNQISNSYYLLTKGEMFEQCKNQKLLRKLLPHTFSCAHPFKWGSRMHQNCGYCYPCLIRRAALNKVGLDDPQHYQKDSVGGGEVISKPTLGTDLREILRFVGSEPSALDLLKSGSLASVGTELSELADVIRRGEEELRSLVESKGHSAVRRHAGLI